MQKIEQFLHELRDCPYSLANIACAWVVLGVAAALCDTIPDHYILVGCGCLCCYALIRIMYGATDAITTIAQESAQWRVILTCLWFVLFPLMIVAYTLWFIVLAMARAQDAIWAVVVAIIFGILKLVTLRVGSICDELFYSPAGLMQHALVVGILTPPFVGVCIFLVLLLRAMVVQLEHLKQHSQVTRNRQSSHEN